MLRTIDGIDEARHRKTKSPNDEILESLSYRGTAFQTSASLRQKPEAVRQNVARNELAQASGYNLGAAAAEDKGPRTLHGLVRPYFLG